MITKNIESIERDLAIAATLDVETSGTLQKPSVGRAVNGAAPTRGTDTRCCNCNSRNSHRKGAKRPDPPSLSPSGLLSSSCTFGKVTLAGTDCKPIPLWRISLDLPPTTCCERSDTAAHLPDPRVRDAQYHWESACVSWPSRSGWTSGAGLQHGDLQRATRLAFIAIHTCSSVSMPP